jgi:hypothetical protein
MLARRQVVAADGCEWVRGGVDEMRGCGAARPRIGRARGPGCPPPLRVSLISLHPPHTHALDVILCLGLLSTTPIPDWHNADSHALTRTLAALPTGTLDPHRSAWSAPSLFPPSSRLAPPRLAPVRFVSPRFASLRPGSPRYGRRPHPPPTSGFRTACLAPSQAAIRRAAPMSYLLQPLTTRVVHIVEHTLLLPPLSLSPPLPHP